MTDRGPRFHLLAGGGRAVIGRAEDTGIPIDDAAASRHHAEVVALASGELRVADLGSRNGTYLNGRPVRNELVGPPVVVRVGSSILLFGTAIEHLRATTSEGPLVGGAALAPARRAIALVGPTDLSVLIRGETGTGKDVVARTIHEVSPRPGPFIAVNCAALPEHLVESELFGHVKGAFTGATGARRGIFSAASGGTLFLDEIAELPLAAQAKLLRVLEDGMVRPVGSDRGQRVDVRVLSATNRELASEIEARRFRPDLFARLAPVEITLPPLRERPEDIPALVEYLLRRANHSAVTIEPDALEALVLYPFPLNVRELESAIRMAVLEDPSAIRFSALPENIRLTLLGRRHDSMDATASSAARTEATDQRQQLIDTLTAHHGNVRRTSNAMGLARSHVYRLLKKWSIDPTEFRPEPLPGRDEARHEGCS